MKFEDGDCLQIENFDSEFSEQIYQQPLTVTLYTVFDSDKHVSFDCSPVTVFKFLNFLNLISPKNKDLTKIENLSSKRNKLVFEALVRGIGLNGNLSIKKQDKNEILTIKYNTKENLDILLIAEKSGDESVKVERTDQDQKLIITGKYTFDKFVDLCEAVLQNQNKAQPSEKVNPRIKK